MSTSDLDKFIFFKFLQKNPDIIHTDLNIYLKNPHVTPETLVSLLGLGYDHLIAEHPNIDLKIINELWQDFPEKIFTNKTFEKMLSANINNENNNLTVFLAIAQFKEYMVRYTDIDLLALFFKKSCIEGKARFNLLYYMEDSARFSILFNILLKIPVKDIIFDFFQEILYNPTLTHSTLWLIHSYFKETYLQQKHLGIISSILKHKNCPPAIIQMYLNDTKSPLHLDLIDPIFMNDNLTLEHASTLLNNLTCYLRYQGTFITTGCIKYFDFFLEKLLKRKDLTPEFLDSILSHELLQKYLLQRDNRIKLYWLIIDNENMNAILLKKHLKTNSFLIKALTA